MVFAELMKKLEPYMAIIIFVICLISLSYGVKYVKLNQDIQDDCGYDRGDRIYCVCDKDIVSQIQIDGNPYYEGEVLDPKKLQWD